MPDRDDFDRIADAARLPRAEARAAAEACAAEVEAERGIADQYGFFYDFLAGTCTAAETAHAALQRVRREVASLPDASVDLGMGDGIGADEIAGALKAAADRAAALSDMAGDMGRLARCAADVAEQAPQLERFASAWADGCRDVAGRLAALEPSAIDAFAGRVSRQTT